MFWMVGGLGCGWAKLNALQNRWLAYRLSALLILRRVGIFSVIFCSFFDGRFGLLG